MSHRQNRDNNFSDSSFVGFGPSVKERISKLLLVVVNDANPITQKKATIAEYPTGRTPACAFLKEDKQRGDW